MSGVPKSVPSALVGLALAVFAGCSGDAEETDARPISGAPKQVAAVVERLDRATRSGDFAEICERLLTPAARQRAGGKGCEASLRASVGEVRRPRIQIVSIAIEGDRALVRVRTRARGQGPIDEAIELERRGGPYRIAALAG